MSRRRPGLACLGTAMAMLGAIVILALGAYWQLFLRPERPVVVGEPVQVEVRRGSTTAEIGRMMASTGVVENSNMFRLRARVAGYDGDFRAGVYDLTTGMRYESVFEELRKGPSVKYSTVAVPEGFTVEQIAARLEKQSGIPAAEFKAVAADAKSFGRDWLNPPTNSLEGYLFPKTYRVKEGTDARGAADMMLDQFERETYDLDMSRAQQFGMDLHEIVTLASMVEREARLDKERPLVSSVIYNRLARNMLLEIDATIEYVLPGNRFRLRTKHTLIDSPYNTYRYKGLPPGPIASPGLASLKAAAAPADTDYIYYVLTSKDGGHTFTRTFEEFQKAKEKSRRVFGR